MCIRARNDDEKERKRERLLDVANQLLEESPGQTFSMDLLAKRGNVAKGTLYLYFRNKEEVFLGVHNRDLVAICNELQQLSQQNETLALETLVTAMAQGLTQNPRLLSLGAICTMAEHKISEVSQLTFHQHVSATIRPVVAELQRHFPHFTELHLLQAYATALGFWQMFKPSEIQKKLREEGLCIYELHPDLELTDLIQTSLLRVMSDIA